MKPLVTPKKLSAWKSSNANFRKKSTEKWEHSMFFQDINSLQLGKWLCQGISIPSASGKRSCVEWTKNLEEAHHLHLLQIHFPQHPYPLGKCWTDI